jgi:hypothetical protein
VLGDPPAGPGRVSASRGLECRIERYPLGVVAAIDGGVLLGSWSSLGSPV